MGILKISFFISDLIKIVMEKYTVKYEAVIDLHERGFSEDFKLVSNDLLWVQEKKIIPAGDFSIREYHHFYDDISKRTGIIIFGVEALYQNIKGILINHYQGFASATYPSMKKKLKEVAYLK
jgi:hypothetical protein